MAVPGIQLDAYVVIDNSVLVILCEYCCDCQSKPLAARHIPAIKKWLEEQLDILRQFTPDGLIHCTGCVASEFKPGVGRLSQSRTVGPRDVQSLANHVCTLLHQEDIDAQDVLFLRHLPAAPRKLVGPDGLSDNDLSLIVLGTRLAGQGKPVYLLTNDQDLLAFASWVRTRPDARAKWATIGDLQALHGLTYLVSVGKPPTDRSMHTISTS